MSIDPAVFAPGERIAIGNVAALVCPECHCHPRHDSSKCGRVNCETCRDAGFVTESGAAIEAASIGNEFTDSRAKIAAMCVRYSNGESLFDPRDRVLFPRLEYAKMRPVQEMEYDDED